MKNIIYIVVGMLSVSRLLVAQSVDIETLAGTLYKGVTVSKVEPDGITIETDAGLERLRFTELSKETQLKYGYDAAKIAEAVERKLQGDAKLPERVVVATKITESSKQRANVNLDAPAVKPVTIRTEIKRGMDAVSHASQSVNILSLSTAFDSVKNLNKQKNTDTDAFLLGAYYQYWLQLSISLKVDKGMTANPPEVYREGVKWMHSSHAQFREKQKTLGLDDVSFAEAAGVISSYTGKFTARLSNPRSMIDEK